jgi:hypothetical protein
VSVTFRSRTPARNRGRRKRAECSRREGRPGKRRAPASISTLAVAVPASDSPPPHPGSFPVRVVSPRCPTAPKRLCGAALIRFSPFLPFLVLGVSFRVRAPERACACRQPNVSAKPANVSWFAKAEVDDELSASGTRSITSPKVHTRRGRGLAGKEADPAPAKFETMGEAALIDIPKNWEGRTPPSRAATLATGDAAGALVRDVVAHHISSAAYTLRVGRGGSKRRMETIPTSSLFPLFPRALFACLH